MPARSVPLTLSIAAIIASILTACSATSPAQEKEPKTQTIDSTERVRANDALDVFQDLATRDEWYAVYYRGERSGFYERTRSVRDGQIEVQSVLSSRNEEVAERTIIERFDAGAPHDATLLEVREANGDAARIIRTPTGYVGEYTRDGVSQRDTLFDFRFRLADALAAEIWIKAGAEIGDCLTYPGYSLSTFKRQFNRECLIEETEHTVDGSEVDAVRTRINALVRTLRERKSGMELVSRPSYGLELRLEPRAVSTRRHVPVEASPGR